MQMKKQHPDCVLLFRMGDFYETFYEDAKTAHKILGITLTARDKNSENPVPMAGIPHHALEKYLPKLIRAGCKVAIADQVGDVIPGKLVQRAVTQVITPGTRVEEGKGMCYLLAIAQSGQLWHIARGDRSLGIRHTRSFAEQEQMLKFVLQLAPVEIVLAEDVPEKSVLEHWIQDHLSIIVSIVPLPTNAVAWLKRLLGVTSLDGFGENCKQGREIALICVFAYVQNTQETVRIRRLEYRQTTKRVGLDLLTTKNLELFVSSYQGNKHQSLYGVINTCVTPMGGRLLAQRLQEPTHDMELLQHRHDHIERWYEDRGGAEQVRTWLQPIGDLPRILQKLATGSGSSISWLVQLRERCLPLVHDEQMHALLST